MQYLVTSPSVLCDSGEGHGQQECPKAREEEGQEGQWKTTGPGTYQYRSSSLGGAQKESRQGTQRIDLHFGGQLSFNLCSIRCPYDSVVALGTSLNP